MKRLLAGMLIALLSSSAFGAPRTASVDGLWSATATWGGAAVPVAADDCTINAAVEVICDSATCSCGSLTINGNLTHAAGATCATIKVGDGLTAGTSDNVTINAGGALQGGPCSRLEFDTDRADEGDKAILTNSGTLVYQGRLIRSGGVIHSFTEPTGSHPNRTITLTDRDHRQASLDEWNGKVLIAKTGWFRHQWFTVTTGAANRNEIVVNIDSRGAVDSRNKTNRVNPTAWAPGDWGMIYTTGTATVASGATTVTFNTAFSSTTRAEEVLLGSRFACSADIGTVDDADFRRFCSVTSTTVAELCTAYGTASCAAGAAFRVYDDNQPPNAYPIVESFSEGDTYEIWDPAVMTVIAANQTDTGQDDNWNLVVGDGSYTVLDGVEIGYCGQRRLGGPAVEISCLVVNDIDNSRSDEGFYASNWEMHHWNGQAALRLNDVSNMTIEEFAIRDAAEGGVAANGAASNEAHGIELQDNADGRRVVNLTIRDGRIVRINDDALSFIVADEGDERVCDGCRLDRLFIGFIPANDGGSAQGFEPVQGMTNSRFSDSFITNINEELIATKTPSTTTAYSLTIYNNVLLNSQTSSAASLGESGSATNSASQVSFVGNYVAGFWLNGALRGNLYSNFFDRRVSYSAGNTSVISTPQSARGNVLLLGPSDKQGGIVHQTTNHALSPSTINILDNAIVAAATPLATAVYTVPGRLGVSSETQPAFNVQHNTVLCNDALMTSGLGGGARVNGASGMVATFKNNLHGDCEEAIDRSAGTVVPSLTYSQFWSLDATCYGVCSPETNNVSTGSLGTVDLQRGDATLRKGAVSQANLGDDGHPRGARVAGPPDFERLRAVFPFLAPIPRVVNITPAQGGQDQDKDGVWDLHDNCDRTPNPGQLDTDGDGAGDACDP